MRPCHPALLLTCIKVLDEAQAVAAHLQRVGAQALWGGWVGVKCTCIRACACVQRGRCSLDPRVTARRHPWFSCQHPSQHSSPKRIPHQAIVHNVVRALQLKGRARLAVPAQRVAGRATRLQVKPSLCPRLRQCQKFREHQQVVSKTVQAGQSLHSRHDDLCQRSTVHHGAHAALVTKLQHQGGWDVECLNGNVRNSVLPATQVD